ncbi:GntR family transcriptional regulator [bacterium LRH843]|nr:GntR family transcriptional regulator [bacterium LRH843]
MKKPKKLLIKDKVYLELQNQIVIGELKPKERLTELDLASQFGCSQAPVREALQKLEEEGLVDLIPYTGVFVTEISFEEIKELFEYRRLIELNALNKAFHLFSKKDFEILEQEIEMMRQAAKDNDIGRLVVHDMQFHRYIVEKAGKKTSLTIWSRIDLQVRRFIAHTHPKYFDNLEEIADTHLPLLRYLRESDIYHAKKELEKHTDLGQLMDVLQL